MFHDFGKRLHGLFMMEEIIHFSKNLSLDKQRMQVTWFSWSLGLTWSLGSVGHLVQLVSWFSWSVGSAGQLVQLVTWLLGSVGKLVQLVTWSLGSFTWSLGSLGKLVQLRRRFSCVVGSSCVVDSVAS